MPTYVYVKRDDNGQIVDMIETIRPMDEREDPYVIDGVKYEYAKGYLNAPRSFILAGPGWTSNSTIRYEDPHEFKSRKETEAKRKDIVQKRNEISGFETDANYKDRIQQGIENMLGGKNSDGSIDINSPNVDKISVGNHENI